MVSRRFAPEAGLDAGALRVRAAAGTGLEAAALRRLADIVEARGLARFLGLYTRKGERVPAVREIRGGRVFWRLRFDSEQVYQAMSLPSAGRILEDRGLRERVELAPAAVVIRDDDGRGPARVDLCRTGCRWGMDATPWRGVESNGGRP